MRIRSSQRPDRGFWADTLQWVQSRRGLAQFLFALLLGFILALGAGVGYRLGVWQIVEEPLRAWFAETKEIAREDLETNDLPTLYFDIGFEEYQTLAAKREEALQKGVLLLDDDDWVPAQIRFRDETVPVRTRLKGDWLDHLGDKKWSFRVKTRNNTVIMGMRSFSVQSPHTRRFLNEWLFLSELRRADILAPRYTFVNVVVNGDDWGLYALEESFSKELFESMGRREGLIGRYDENLMWQRNTWATEKQRQSQWDPASTFSLFAFAEVDEFSTNRVQSDPVLREQSAAALGLLRGFQNKTLATSEVFDAEIMGRYLAHANLWGVGHGLLWHNARYYYNPLTAQLEPIGYDAMVLDPEGFPTELAQYEDLEIMGAYAREMRRICRSEYLEELQTVYNGNFQRFHTALAQEFDPSDLEAPWKELAERQAMLAAVFVDQAQTVYAYQLYKFEPVSPSQSEAEPANSTVALQVGNILRYPVALRGLRFGDKEIAISSDWVSEDDRKLLHLEATPATVLRKAQMKAPRYVTLRIPQPAMETLLPANGVPYTQPLQIVTNLCGLEEEVVVDVRRNYPPVLKEQIRPVQPSLEEALEQYAFLGPSEHPDCLELKPGTWDVDGDLLLPDGYALRADQPVTLRFDQDALLLSTGPLVLEGPQEGSIALVPKGDHWAGIIVLRAGADTRSILRNVEIRGTSGIHRMGWIATAGTTFYESPVVLNQVRFLDSNAHSALNIVRSTFEITRSEFGHLASHAFDADFGQGSIAHTLFHDLRGNAIEASGSEVSIQDVGLLRIRDVGISAGEGSVLDAADVRVADVAIGIASKDMSRVSVQGITISRASIAGLAAYLEKEEYGTASIEATDVLFHDRSPRTLCQVGSRILLNDERVLPIELDVNALQARLEAQTQIKPLDYRLGSAISLTGYLLYPTNLKPGEKLYVVLRWQTAAQLDQDYTIFAHVLDASGNRVAQRDSMPRDNSFPTSRWPVNQPIEELRAISLPKDLAAGEYRLYTGMYLYQTGERLPVTGPNGENLPGAAITLEETVYVSR